MERVRPRQQQPRHTTRPTKKAVSADRNNFERRALDRACDKVSSKRSRVVCLSLLLVSASFLFQGTHHIKDIQWALENRYLYVGCPEKALWTRRPNFAATAHNHHHQQRREPRILHVSAKFGRDKDHDSIDHQVRTHGQTVRDMRFFANTTSSSDNNNNNNIVLYSRYPQVLRQDPAWTPHLAFLDNPALSARGGGYWFWKPALLQHHLRNGSNSSNSTITTTTTTTTLLDTGDFLMYSDVDMVDWLSWAALLLETMVERGANLALYEQQYSERDWTKRDVYDSMCVDRMAQDDTSMQYQAGWLVIRKDAGSMQLIDDWVEASKHFDWINDSGSKRPNLSTFREHRHDQSLLSLLLKCRYGEPKKEAFPHTCLRDWTIYTFTIDPK